MSHFLEVYETAKDWTREAGKKLKNSLGDILNVEYKTTEADLVTEKDREIEEFFIKNIRETYPHHRIIGEEGVHSEEQFNPEEEIVWLIDPIDGTTSFVHQKENFAISVAIYENGKPRIGIIYDPIKDECFHTLIGHGAYLNDEKLKPLTNKNVKHSLIGIDSNWLIPNDRYDYVKFHPLIKDLRGTRIIGSAALEMAAVACGRLNGFISLRLSPWDYAAGLVILNELGAKVTNIENDPITLFEISSIFAGNHTLHTEVMEDYLLLK
jgi:myo-inositol-1(or 4)-monophosphatase